MRARDVSWVVVVEKARKPRAGDRHPTFDVVWSYGVAFFTPVSPSVLPVKSLTFTLPPSPPPPPLASLPYPPCNTPHAEPETRIRVPAVPRPPPPLREEGGRQGGHHPGRRRRAHFALLLPRPLGHGGVRLLVRRTVTHSTTARANGSFPGRGDQRGCSKVDDPAGCLITVLRSRRRWCRGMFAWDFL